MKEILAILILIGQTYHVEDGEVGTTMINFEGKAKSEYFEGEVVKGGVDTQTHWSKDSTTLSARYMLQGRDAEGNECSVFIENNGCFCPSGNGTTTPRIITDSPVLRRFSKNPLMGKLDFSDKGLTIRIYGTENE